MDKKIRLFFIVESADTNEEIFHTYEDAQAYARELQDDKQEVYAYIGTVKNAHKDEDGWNYEDYSDTFNRLYPIDLFKVYQAH